MKIVTTNNLYTMWEKIKLQITAITDPIKQRLSAVEQALQNASNPKLIHCMNNPVYFYAPTPDEDISPFILPPDCDIRDHIEYIDCVAGVTNDLNISSLSECLDTNPTWSLPTTYPHTNSLSAQDLSGAQVCSLYLRQVKAVENEEGNMVEGDMVDIGERDLVDIEIISYAFVGVVWKNTDTDNLMMRLINIQETKFSSMQLIGDTPSPI